MRPTTLLQLVVGISSFTPIVSAWPGWLPELDSLVVRQDSSEDSTTAAKTRASATNTDAKETGATKTDDDDMNTAKPTSTSDSKSDDDDKETSKDSKTTKKTSSKTKSIPATAAVGSVNIQNPVTTAIPTALYKIGDNITFAWNYTNLVNSPTAVDVLLSCSTASETWSLTSNMTFETEVNFVWNSKEQADDVEAPLLTEMYTLIIKDSEAEVSEAASPGVLGSFQDFKFGLYAPIKYTPWAEWECVGCNAASANFGDQVIKLAFTMCFITIFTFTWFVTGWGIH